MKKQLIKTGKVLLAAALGFSMIPVSVHAEETDHPCEKNGNGIYGPECGRLCIRHQRVQLAA